MKKHLQRSQAIIQLRRRRTSMQSCIHAILLAVTFLIICNSFSLAEIRYVSKTGSSTPPYTSWETAADSIQKCIDISQFGDTIYVANGVYKEQVVMIPGLSLIGAGMDSCVIDTRGFVDPRSIYVKEFCLVKNFKVITSNFDNQYLSYRGTGIYAKAYLENQTTLVTLNSVIQAYSAITCRGNVTIRNNTLNNVNNGIRPGSVVSYPTFQEITSNYISSFGTSIRLDLGGTPHIANNICIGKGGFSGSYSGLNEIYNNLFINKGGTAVAFSDSTLFYNNVITGYSEEGMWVGFSSPKEIINNHIQNAVIGVNGLSSNDDLIQYNNFWNVGVISENIEPPDSTNLSFDPMFVNDDSTKGELDFHLQMFSPLIDAGDPSILDVDSTRSDIGLYGGPLGETYTYIDLAPRAPRGLTLEADTGKATVTILWQPNTEADFSFYKVFRDTAPEFTADSTTLISSQTDTFYTHIIPPDSRQFYYKLTAVDSQGNQSDVSEEIGVNFTSLNNEPKILESYYLYQNYPNPFNPETKIGYKLKESGYVKLAVYDIKGELISYIVNKNQLAGYHETEFNAEGLSSGIYLYRIDVRSENNIPVYSEMKKMLLVK